MFNERTEVAEFTRGRGRSRARAASDGLSGNIPAPDRTST
jgi:hypothetical protein